MALLTKCAHPFLANPRAPFRMGPYVAGEVLPVACPCFIHTDGKAYKCVQGTVGGVAAYNKWDGFCIQGAAAIGDPITLFGVGAEITCTSGAAAGAMIIGGFVWIGATGTINPAVGTTATDIPFAKSISVDTIRIVRPPL